MSTQPTVGGSDERLKRIEKRVDFIYISNLAMWVLLFLASVMVLFYKCNAKSICPFLK